MIQRFADVAIDPERVIAVSRHVNDDAPITSPHLDQSGLVLRDNEDKAVVINISANGAAALLEHFGKRCVPVSDDIHQAAKLAEQVGACRYTGPPIET